MTSLITAGRRPPLQRGHATAASPTVLGSHPRTVAGVAGTTFAVWAPNAATVSVIGDFNGWDRARHPLAPVGRLRASGRASCPASGHGDALQVPHRARTTAATASTRPTRSRFCAEVPPAHRLGRLGPRLRLGRRRLDGRAPRQRNALDAPLSIYEVHLGSWRRVARGRAPLRSATASSPPPLAAHVTRARLHPRRAAAGHGAPVLRLVGLPDDRLLRADRAATATPQDFMCARRPRCTSAGIGVILDWVPSHFPTDEHGLAYFDGTHLYEHADPRQGFHPDWNSAIFNYGRNEVRSFLTLERARFWLDRYHVDGLRVDAVASMLYLDYSRKRGRVDPQRARRPREPRGDRLPAPAQRARLPRRTPTSRRSPRSRRPGRWCRARSTMGGLGFGLKWDMGWMHDTLEYFAHDPIHRRYHHDELTFRALYAFTENFVLPLSHDEVVHGKGSLLAQDARRRLAEVRQPAAAASATCTRSPGKKLLFMGGEFAPARRVEPRAEPRLAPARRGAARAGRSGSWPTSTACTASEPALHELDVDASGLRVGRRERPRGQRPQLPAAQPQRRHDPVRVQLHAGAAPELPGRRAARGPLARAPEQRRHRLRRQRPGQPRRGRGAAGSHARPPIVRRC